MARQANRSNRVWTGFRAIFRRPADVLAVIPGVLVAGAVASMLLSPRSGLLAMAMVFEPLLFIGVILVLGPVARTRAGRPCSSRSRGS